MKDVGISIDGIGEELDASSNGHVWTVGGASPSGTGYTWSGGLEAFPTPSKNEADPRTMDLTLGGFAVELAMRPSIMRKLLARQDQAPYSLQSDIADNDITIDLGAPDLIDPPAAVYIGSETMVVTLDNGDGTYSVDHRGHWSSEAADHPEGAGVYTRPPYYRNRLVHFWVLDNGTMTRRGRGYLDDVDTKDGQIAIKLKVEGPFSALQEVERMRHNPIVEVDLEVVEIDDDRGPVMNIQPNFGGDGHDSVVAKKFDASFRPRDDWYAVGAASTDEAAWFQVDGAISTLQYDPSVVVDPITGETRIAIGSGASSAIEGNGFESEETGPVDDAEVYELAFWHRELEASPYPLADAEEVFENPYQPLAIAGALICSGDNEIIRPQELDFVSANVGLGVDWILGEPGRQSLIDLANEDYEVEIDQLELGWDGEPVQLLDTVLYKLMLPFGYWFAPSAEGYLICRRFDPLTVKTLAEALANEIELLVNVDQPPTIRQKPGYGRILQRYTATLGETDVYDGTTVDGLGVGATARLDKMVEPEESEFDFSTWETSRRELVHDIITRQVIFLGSQMPEVSIKANDWSLEGLDYSIGEWATVTVPEGADAVFYDEEGEWIDEAELAGEQFAMMITGRGWNTETDAYELDGLFAGFTHGAARFIAPEAKVASVSMPSSNLMIITVDTSDDEVLAALAAEFSVGQDVQLHDSDFAPRESTVAEIVDISGDDIEVSPVFTNEPDPGDWLRLARFDEYDHNDFGTFRGYCYYADANDRLGSSDEEADQWQ